MRLERGTRRSRPLGVWHSLRNPTAQDNVPAPMADNILCIFDLDGTLYRTETSFVPTMRRVYEEFDLTYPGDAKILSLVGETYATFLKWLVSEGFPVDVPALGERITEIEITSIERHGELFPDVEDTLVALRGLGCSIALCTNGDMRYATYVLGTRGILAQFDVLKTNDDDQQSKTQMVASLLSEMKPAVSFMVGDRYHDVQAGNENGCVTVAAGYGYGSRSELEPATHRIDRLADLLPLVRAQMQVKVSPAP